MVKKKVEVKVVENKEVTVAKGQVTKALSAAQDLVVKTDEDLAKASELRSKIKQAQKWITGVKDQVLKPLLQAVSAERARWKPMEDNLIDALGVVNQKMVAYNNAKEEAAREEEARIKREFEKGNIKKPETAVKKIENIDRPVSTVGTSQFKKIKKVRVVDESKIPDKYWVLDMVRINADAKAGLLTSGVEVYEETITSGY